MKKIVALILAGGKSKRFWPLSDKNLIKFTSENLLDYHLNCLANFGIKDFIVTCSPEIAAYLRVNQLKFKKITIHRVLQDDKNHGIGKAVLLSADIIKKKYPQRPVYIINCDDIYDSFLHKEMFRNFEKEQKPLVATYEVKSYKPLGYFAIDNGKIIGLIEKPDERKLPSNLVNMSLHLFPDFIKLTKLLEEESTKDDFRDDLYERALNDLCKAEKVNFIKYQGRWEILKYPWDTLAFADYFLKKVDHKIAEDAFIDKSAKITGSVIIESGVKILEFARIVGPAIIKKDTVIGTGSMVRESIIGENCVVGYHSEVTRSYVGNNCWFHSNYIGDSVIGNKVNMGAGAVLANLRIDQKNISSWVNNNLIDTGRIKLGSIIGNFSQIGVNASLMPGVKVGKNCVVGPSLVLTNDLPDGSSIFLNSSFIKKNNSIQGSTSSRKQFKELLKI